MRFDGGEAPSSPGGYLRLAFALLFLGGLMIVALDATARANGLYGERVVATETVVDKRLLRGRRNSEIPQISLRHRGQLLKARVMREEYDRIALGFPLKVIVVPSRFSDAPTVFLDRSGIKHTPDSRFAVFGLIIALHVVALFGAFQWIIHRSKRRDMDRAEAFQARRLGLRRV
jgi:hypothetical protein